MKQLIKYAALLFALILSASIIGGCLTVGISLVQGLVDEFSYPEELEGKDNSIWHRDEDGNVYFLGTKFADDVQVKSGAEQFDAAEITAFDINVGSVELIMEAWDSDDISVEYENVPVEYEFYIDDETLVIDRKDSFSFIWNVSFEETPKIIVSVPVTKTFEKVTLDKGAGSAKLIGLTADEINVENGSGGLGISDVTAKILRVDSGSGGVNISDCTTEKSVFDSGSGSFIVKNCALGITSMDSGSGTVMLEDVVAKNLMLETGSGRADVSGVLTGKCEFESGSGSLNVVVYGNEEDYNYRTDMGSGSFYIDGKKANKYSKDDKRAQYMLVFEAGSGRVSLEFDETKTINTDGTTEGAIENTSDNTQSGGNYER